MPPRSGALKSPATWERLPGEAITIGAWLNDPRGLQLRCPVGIVFPDNCALTGAAYITEKGAFGVDASLAEAHRLANEALAEAITNLRVQHYLTHAKAA